MRALYILAVCLGINRVVMIYVILSDCNLISNALRCKGCWLLCGTLPSKCSIRKIGEIIASRQGGLSFLHTSSALPLIIALIFNISQQQCHFGLFIVQPCYSEFWWEWWELPGHQVSPKAMNFVLQTLRDGVREASSGGGLTASSVVMAAPAASRSGH